MIANNGLYRSGGAFWNEDQEFGAITLFPSSQDITGVTIRDTDISDSTYDGIQFKNGGGNMPNVVISNVRIDKSNNGAGILAMSGARGNATLTNVTITNSADGNIVDPAGLEFRDHRRLVHRSINTVSVKSGCPRTADTPISMKPVVAAAQGPSWSSRPAASALSILASQNTRVRRNCASSSLSVLSPTSTARWPSESRSATARAPPRSVAGPG